MRNILSSAALLLLLSSGSSAQNRGSGGGNNHGSGGQSKPPQQHQPQQYQPQNPRPVQQQPKPQPKPPQQPRTTQTPWQGGKPNNGNKPGGYNYGEKDKPRGGDYNQPWGYGPRPGDKRPDWNGGKGSDWGRGGDYGWNHVGGKDGGWREGRKPDIITIGYNPDWNWNQPNYYQPIFYTSYISIPIWEVLLIPIITIEGPPIAQPDAGCIIIPTTKHTTIEAEATFTSTITEAPDGKITIYQDQDGLEYTYGASTIYEIFIYTTTQSVDVIGDGVQCGSNGGGGYYDAPGGGWAPPPRKRGERMVVKHLREPARVEARVTGVV